MRAHTYGVISFIVSTHPRPASSSALPHRAPYRVRMHAKVIGDLDRIAAKIIASTTNILTLQYEGVTRRCDDGKLLERQLVVVAPGVYRWRETSWPPEVVNIVVGVKCSA